MMKATYSHLVVRFAGALLILLSGSSPTVPAALADPPAPPAPMIPPPVQPANIGDLKTEATHYYDSGAYLTDLQLTTAPATAWINEEAPRVERPAVVFDIDETALSNWEAIKANNFSQFSAGPCAQLPQGPCGLREWALRVQATLIPPTMDVYHAAKERGAAIFFITGRGETLRAATEQNLRAVGYTSYTQLIMKPAGTHYASAAEFKAPHRARIQQQGYTIIANIGDQPSDLGGGSPSGPTCCRTRFTASPEHQPDECSKETVMMVNSARDAADTSDVLGRRFGSLSPCIPWAVGRPRTPR